MPTPLDIQEYFVINYSFIPGEIGIIPRYFAANADLGWESSLSWANDYGIIKSPTNTSVTPKQFATYQDALDYFYSDASTDILSQANAVYGSGFYSLGNRVKVLDVYQNAINSSIAAKFNGTTAQYVRGDGTLATYTGPSARSFATPSRTAGTAFQISSTRDAEVFYSIPVTSSATVVAGSRASGSLKYADNVGMTTNVVTLAGDDFGIGSGLLVTGYGTLKLSGVIPANKYVLISTANVAGTPTIGSISAQEVLV